MLQENPFSVSSVPESFNPTYSKEQKPEKSPEPNISYSTSKIPSSNTTESVLEKSKAGASDNKAYSRSMYANLGRTDIEVESNSLEGGVSVKPSSQLQTSTPIKFKLSSTSG